jgi:predicted esterase
VKKTKVTTEFPMEYDLITSPEAKRTYILLHGFYESAAIIKEKLLSLIPTDSNILIPNGCFPLPKRRAHGWDIFFSWYFFDEATQSFYVEYDFPAAVLEKLVKQLGLESAPITIIGYSQGGYLSPFLAERLPACDKVIGLGCSYKFDMLEKTSHYTIDGIHGDADNKVDPVNAQNFFNKLDSKIKGNFTVLPGVGHELNDLFFKAIKQIIS